MNKYKNELLYFIIYFIFVMIFPILIVPLVPVAFIYQPINILEWIVANTAFAICFFTLTKIQLPMLFIPTLIIQIKSKNPLLLRLLTDIKLNNKIFAIGFCFDLLISLLICIILCITDSTYDIQSYIPTYWIYLSFSVNYIVIYLFAFIKYITFIEKDE